MRSAWAGHNSAEQGDNDREPPDRWLRRLPDHNPDGDGIPNCETGGAADPVNFMKLFDRQVSIRMGQANVRRWSDQLLELLSQDEDVFDVAVDGQYAHTPPVEGDPDERDDPRERLDDDFDVASAREQNREQRQSNPNGAPGDGDPSVVDGS